MKFLLSRAGLFLVVVGLVVGSTGCSKKPKNLTPLPAGGASTTAPTGEVPLDGGVGRAGSLPTTNGGVGSNNLASGFGTEGFGNESGLNPDLDPRNKYEDREFFAADTIYFGFDKSNVQSQYNANISRVADHLKGHPADAVLIEGHCDERGTEEYNLALGERRALAIREKLMAAGVSGDRITTISYGKEKPVVVPAFTEEDHAKNRRGIFILLMPPSGIR